MKRILVPTDFSACAENALKAASQIAKKTNADIHLLHVLELPNQANDISNRGASNNEMVLFIKKASQVLDGFLEKPYLQGVDVYLGNIIGKPTDVILNYAEENEIDLIVMGAHGISFLENIFTGSNTNKIAHQSEIPLLIVKNEVENINTADFVFASDFTQEAKSPFIKLVKFANLCNATIHLVTISTPEKFISTSEADELMKKFMSDIDFRNYTSQIYSDVNIEKGIYDFSHSIDADLIAICNHERSGFLSFLKKSVSDDLAKMTNKPLLIFKAKN